MCRRVNLQLLCNMALVPFFKYSLWNIKAMGIGRGEAKTASVTIENIKCFQYSYTLQRSYLILRSQRPLLGQDPASRPPGGGGGSSFSLPSSAASPLPASPPRWREHASEAGSPTLEQVLLISRHSAGTPSPAGAGYGSLNHERITRSSSPQLKTLS